MDDLFRSIDIARRQSVVSPSQKDRMMKEIERARQQISRRRQELEELDGVDHTIDTALAGRSPTYSHEESASKMSQRRSLSRSNASASSRPTSPAQSPRLRNMTLSSSRASSSSPLRARPTADAEFSDALHVSSPHSPASSRAQDTGILPALDQSRHRLTEVKSDLRETRRSMGFYTPVSPTRTPRSPISVDQHSMQSFDLGELHQHQQLSRPASPHASSGGGRLDEAYKSELQKKRMDLVVARDNINEKISHIDRVLSNQSITPAPGRASPRQALHSKPSSPPPQPEPNSVAKFDALNEFFRGPNGRQTLSLYKQEVRSENGDVGGNDTLPDPPQGARTLLSLGYIEERERGEAERLQRAAAERRGGKFSFGPQVRSELTQLMEEEESARQVLMQTQERLEYIEQERRRAETTTDDAVLKASLLEDELNTIRALSRAEEVYQSYQTQINAAESELSRHEDFEDLFDQQ